MNDLRQQRRRQQQAAENKVKQNYTFVVIPKGKCVDAGPFFEEIFEGCQDRAGELGNVRYDCFGNDRFPLELMGQDQILANLTLAGNVHGIAISVLNESQVIEPIAKAVDAGIPVVTFDSDAPLSRRAAYIGTDNVAMGRELGKVLNQIRPEGGKYVIVSGTGPNLLDRQKGVREALRDTAWTELGRGGVSPLVPEGNDPNIILELMWEMVEESSRSRCIYSRLRHSDASRAMERVCEAIPRSHHSGEH